MEVRNLFEYPIKGLKGSRVCCASVNSRGLKMDRRWMIVDSSNSFLSQRQLPAMTQLLPSFQDSLRITDLISSEKLEIQIEDFVNQEEVEVWGQVVDSKVGSEEANKWLADKLGQSVRLVFMDEENIRPIRSVGDKIVSFADGYPLLLTGSASLDDLNEKLDLPIGIERFRTNIHLQTNQPFEEEAWEKVKIGDVVFSVAKKCARCHVINIDQNSGKASKEPLKTLSAYRKEGNKVNFGVNLIPETFGLIHEGDKLQVLS